MGLGVFLQPKNTLPRINHLWLYVSVDAEDGNEGVVAAPVGGVMMPLVAADDKRLSQLTPIAQKLSNISKMKLKLVKFSHREEIHEITPDG